MTNNPPCLGVGTTKHENPPQIPLYAPLQKGDFMISLFGKEGVGGGIHHRKGIILNTGAMEDAIRGMDRIVREGSPAGHVS